MRRVSSGALVGAVLLSIAAPSAAQSPPVPPQPAPPVPGVPAPGPAPVVPPVAQSPTPLPGAPAALPPPPGYTGPPIAPPGAPPPPGTVPAPVLPPDVTGVQAPTLRQEILDRPRDGGTLEEFLDQENLERVIGVAAIVVIGGAGLIFTLIQRRRRGGTG